MALYGIDISKWQGAGFNLDVAGDFAIIKATEGTGYVDPLCDKFYQQAKAKGLLRGVYHFARPDLGHTGEAEAEYFVSQIKGYIGDAVLVLDYECAPYSDEWAYAFAKRVHDLTGVWPMLYASASKINGYNWSKTAQNCGLWIAGYPNKYNVKNPPKPSTSDMPYKIGNWAFWAIWQYTSSAGTLDRDIAYMDAEAWRKYAAVNGEVKPSPTPAPTPTPTPAPQPAKKTNGQIADEVIAGKWGNGADRKARLEQAGYDYNAIQAIVNQKLGYGVIRYAVRRGDTLSSIAAKYGTTWQKIAKDNNIKNPNLIFPSQVLIIKK